MGSAVQVAGLAFDVRDLGPQGGEVVLALHGFPQTSWSWRHVWPALTAAGYRVVAPDQRGCSPGARPAGAGQYAMAAVVSDALGLLDRLGAERAHLLGHDWGAAVAWQIAARHPERVRTLTAVSVPHPLAFAEALRSDPDQRQRSRYMREFAVPGAEDALLADDTAGLRALFAGDGGTVDVEQVLSVVAEPAVLRRCLDWYAAQSSADLEGLGPVTVPTTYVWSDRDLALGRVAAEATRSHVAAPYRFEVLPGVSHWVPEQAPDALVELVLERLRSAGQGRAT